MLVVYSLGCLTFAVKNYVCADFWLSFFIACSGFFNEGKGVDVFFSVWNKVIIRHNIIILSIVIVWGW